jgi:hypothetical protein
MKDGAGATPRGVAVRHVQKQDVNVPLTGGTVTLPTLKQYSTTEKQHTTPPSSLGFRARTDATVFAASSELSESSESIPGVVAPVRVPVLLP